MRWCLLTARIWLTQSPGAAHPKCTPHHGHEALSRSLPPAGKERRCPKCKLLWKYLETWVLLHGSGQCLDNFSGFPISTHFRRENTLRFFPDAIRMGRRVPPGDGRGQAQLTRDLVMQKLQWLPRQSATAGEQQGQKHLGLKNHGRSFL